MSERRFQKHISSQESVRRNVEESQDAPKRDMAKMTGKERRAELLRKKEQKEMVEVVMETDPYEKALTGRTPEIIEQETGIPKQEMFPEKRDILYVGDPWQRMGVLLDSENMHIVDYQFGESASFIKNDEVFYKQLFGDEMNRKLRGGDDEDDFYTGEIPTLLAELSDLRNDSEATSQDRSWLDSFALLIENAVDLSKQAVQSHKGFDGYEKAADAWKAAKNFLEETYKKELERLESSDTQREVEDRNGGGESSLGDFRRQAWYKCVHAERGFRDIPDYQMKVLPEINGLRKTLAAQGFSEEIVGERVAKAEVKIIDKLRFRKKPTKTQVVQAAFPELPFDDESFDRFVASWSISAHTFGEFGKEDFMRSWDEIDRLLRERGEGYIFPLHYTRMDDDAFLDSLEEFCDSSGLRWELLDEQGESVDDINHAYTLKLVKEYNRDLHPPSVS